MLIYQYDGTFEGLLTCIFEGYSSKHFPEDITTGINKNRQLFTDSVLVESDSMKAARVWTGIQQKLSANNKDMVYYAFLSGVEGMEMAILRFARRLFNENVGIETDLGDPDVLEIIQNARKVKKEAMRIMQFVRFQQTKDGIYFCGIEPMYDILPLVVGHFRIRFADQQWLLYDLKRNYGAYYNMKTVTEVELSSSKINKSTGAISENVLNEGDTFYQELWKLYFRNISIKERKNLRLQRQHMPRRFWKYLTEKQ